MSHSKLRQEPTCLNCGQTVHARYCSYCGQENKEPHETFWSLMVHFIEDIFHYDGKLFATIKLLFTKPGFLSREYLGGKRTTFLHPIRFYLFTSAFFFICLFYVFQPLKEYMIEHQAKQKTETSNSLLESIKFNMAKDKIGNPESFEAYLKEQAKLPLAKRDSEFEQKLVRQVYSVGKEYTNSEDLVEALLDTILHKLSTLLFLALPLLAFILQLVFIRRKGFYYMHHGIFVLHVATSLFIVLFFTEVFGILSLSTHLGWIDKISTWLILGWFVYYFISFKRFYQISWKKSVIFFTVTAFLQQLLLILIFLGLFVFSFFSL